MLQKAGCWVFLGLCLTANLAMAEPAPVPGTAREDQDDIWNRTRETASELWDRAMRSLHEGPGEAYFRHIWEEIVPRLQETLILEERTRHLPENAWFREDRSDNRQAMESLMDESVAILSTSPGRDYRETIRTLEREMAGLKERIAQLRQSRVGAPEESLWQKTRADYEKELEDLEEALSDRQDQLREVRRTFADDLRSLGLEVSDAQLEFMLSTVVGGDLVDLAVAFDNVKHITTQLETLMVESAEDLDAARRYYGMYLVLLKTVDHMHGRMMEALDQRYLPQIDGILSRTRELVGETRSLARQAPGSRGTLEANRRAQEYTLAAATRYRSYLEDQNRTLAKARERLRRDISVAENTYETVKVSGELVGLVQSSQRLLDSLLELQVPPLRTFENLAMQREFEKLTRIMQGPASGS